MRRAIENLIDGMRPLAEAQGKSLILQIISHGCHAWELPAGLLDCLRPILRYAVDHAKARIGILDARSGG